MSEFKPGNVVQLKSGGPIMTVGCPDDSEPGDPEPDSVWCIWFSFKGTKRESTFPKECLMIVETEKTVGCPVCKIGVVTSNGCNVCAHTGRVSRATKAG